MKLIIDVPEGNYKALKKMSSFNLGVYHEMILNGIPLEEELQKIKDEIQDLIDFEESCCGNATLGYECLGVINNKLSELKGGAE